MNLFIYTGASRLNAAVVESATDLTPVSRLPDLIVGDSEPVTVKFLSASGAYESWSGGGTYTLSISIGALGADGVGAYFQTSSFTAVTNGWTGRLDLAASALRSAVGGYLADRPGVTGAPLTLQVRVTDASGNTETYARQSVVISGAVSVPTTADSTPVTYATAADVAADAATASAAAIAAAASASAASGSASTAAGHVTTAGNSATAAAASAVTAGNSATTASGHATTATTQATNAATSASSASTYKDAAATSAASATSSAGTATTQAALATTNGAAQVTLATTQATNAGTSASAAAISAAAALVSEAAALVSKNAAAASAATASAVSGSGNGTFSAAALTGVNSVTAATSTALTLTGGSTGASLVLGATTSGVSTITAGSAATGYANKIFRVLNGAGTASLTGTGDGRFYIGQDAAYNSILSVRRSTGNGITELLNLDDADGLKVVFYNPTSTVFSSQIGGAVGSFNWGNSAVSNNQMRLNTASGNLLIGTTTDAASLAGGLVINGSGTGAAASSTTTGALRVTGGVGVSGGIYAGAASVFGGAVTINAATQLSLQESGVLKARLQTASGVTYLDGVSGNVVLRPGGTAALTLDTGLAATFAGAVTAPYLNSTGGNAFNQFGSGTRTKVTLSGASGEVAFDNGSVDSPGVHFYVGNNANYGVDATASSGLRIIKNMNETGGTVVASFTDTAATIPVPISATSTGRNTFGGTLAVTGVSAGNATSTGILDFSSGATRLLSFGANTGTRGTLSVIGLSSDSSLNTTLLTVSSASAVFSGTISPQQATTAGAPAYVKGAIYFDTTLNKLRVGGATAWETITSV